MTQVSDNKDVTNRTASEGLQVTSTGSQVSNNPTELIVQGTPGNDTLYGGLANELLMGGGGFDYMT